MSFLGRLFPNSHVLNVIISQMADGLSTGGDNLYRGRLGKSGKAKSAIFNRAITELVSGGFVAGEEAVEARAALQADVAGVG